MLNQIVRAVLAEPLFAQSVDAQAARLRADQRTEDQQVLHTREAEIRRCLVEFGPGPSWLVRPRVVVRAGGYVQMQHWMKWGAGRKCAPALGGVRRGLGAGGALLLAAMFSSEAAAQATLVNDSGGPVGFGPNTLTRDDDEELTIEGANVNAPSSLRVKHVKPRA